MWTFEELARADKTTLEEVLIESRAPDPEILKGRRYDGYNHDWLGQRSGRKFRKFFMKKDGIIYGINHLMEQDKDGYLGEWKPRIADGKPAERGYFRVMYVRDITQTKLSLPYRHLTYFDYNVGLNPQRDILARAVRDFVGLPNENDYNLLLGKAYLHFASWLDVFASYFLLKVSF
jgi:hypothetical protein